MTTIARHAIDPELAAEGVERESMVLAGTLEGAATRPQALGMLLSAARGYAGYLSTTGKASDPLCAAIKTGALAAGALFALAAGSGEVEVDLGDKKARLRATGSTDATHPGYWRIGWWMAQLVRNREVINRLASTPLEVLRNSKSRADECQYLFIDALKANQARTDDWSDRLQRAVDATDAERVKLADEEFVLDILVPEMELFFRYTTGAIEPFNETLQFALERHKKYWSRESRKRSSDGYIALGPLAIASLARQAGFVIEVQSDYLPVDLLEGRCVE